MLCRYWLDVVEYALFRSGLSVGRVPAPLRTVSLRSGPLSAIRTGRSGEWAKAVSYDRLFSYMALMSPNRCYNELAESLPAAGLRNKLTVS